MSAMTDSQAKATDLKRPGDSPPPQDRPVKRRAPYAPKACDACRKRKGKCDGQQQCEYCCAKGLICTYTVNQTEWRRSGPLQITNRSLPEGNVSEIFSFIANLQSQLNALGNLVQNVGEAGDGGSATLDQNSADPDLSRLPKDLLPIQIRANAAGRGLSRFIGPTSPVYGLKAAKSTLQSDPGSVPSQDTQTYPRVFTADAAEESETSSDDEDEPQRIATTHRQQKLLRFRENHSLQETTRLLQVYQDIIGDFHPMLPQCQLVDNAKFCYPTDGGKSQSSHVEPQLEEDDLIMLNLAIAIALTTETSSSKFGSAMLRNCGMLFSIRLTRSTSDVNLVIMALLMAFYYFFKDNVVVAWRLCGVAGRLSMELGLHQIETSALSTTDDRSTFGIIISTIIILDRQWSAASGLPIHFADGCFDKALTFEVEVPYLKSMLAFCQMSEKVALPMSQAAKGQICRDDEAFDISNYQVENWRKKTLNDQNFAHPEEWPTKGSTLAPWAILIYLRANTIRKLLLRPFFLPNAPIDVGKRNLDSGLDIVSETIDCLDWLDKNTETYRRLHPHFQHLLASACALFSLMVAFVCKHRSQMSPEVLKKVAQVVELKYHRSLKLAAKYKSSFRASRRLWKYLCSMEEPFRLQGFLPGPVPSEGIDSSKPTLPKEQSTNSGETTTDASDWYRLFPTSFQGLDFGHQRMYDVATDGSARQWYNSDEALVAFGEPDFAWPLNDATNFF